MEKQGQCSPFSQGRLQYGFERPLFSEQHTVDHVSMAVLSLKMQLQAAGDFLARRSPSVLAPHLVEM